VKSSLTFCENWLGKKKKSRSYTLVPF
jgi:hypothetical protein